MNEFGLSQIEKEFTEQVIIDSVRSVSMRIKEMRIKESAPKTSTKSGIAIISFILLTRVKKEPDIIFCISEATKKDAMEIFGDGGKETKSYLSRSCIMLWLVF